MKNDAYEALIQRALNDLYLAAGELERAPRPPQQIRQFVVIPDRIIWPCNNQLRKFYVPGLFRYDHSRYVDSTAYIVMLCCPTPRHVLRALRRIRAITAWCRTKLREANNGK